MTLADMKALLEEREFIQMWRESAKMKYIWLWQEGHKADAILYKDIEIALDRLDAHIARKELDKEAG